MTPKQLERVGWRIWPVDRWKSPLARALGMSYRQINYYTQGKADIPRVVELAALWLEEHPDQAVDLGLTDRQAEALEEEPD